MSTQKQQLRSRYAWLKRLRPDEEETRRLGRQLALDAIRERLSKLPAPDAEMVLGQLVRPTIVRQLVQPTERT